MGYTIPTVERLYACDGCGTTRIGKERMMLGPCTECGGFTYNEAKPDLSGNSRVRRGMI